MILFLEPYFEIKPWAGDELKKIYKCPDGTGEAWIVSGYKGKSSLVTNGNFKGFSLRDLWLNHRELFGNFDEPEFPLLLKLISSKENLSVQVHPNDEYALKKHNSLGKFECWYILPETTNKTITLGVDVPNREELKKVIDDGTLEKHLINKNILPNDLIIVDPGRVHAINGGTFLLETQESCDITYRLYDYNRLPKRELHIEDSLNVIDFNNDKNILFHFSNNDAFKSKYFDLIKTTIENRVEIENTSFAIFYVLNGEGTINSTAINKGDAFIVTSDEKKIVIEGNLQVIEVLPKKR